MQANFVGVFVGIESPDTATLIAMRKKQNTRRSIAREHPQDLRRRPFRDTRASSSASTARSSRRGAMIELIEEAAIPVCMVGLLYALPNTQLTRRLEKEGRLHPPPSGRIVEERGPVHAWGSTSRHCGRGRKSLPTTCVFSNGSMIRSPMRAGCSGWRRCSTIRAASSRPALNIRGASLADSKCCTGSLQNLPEPRGIFRRTLTQCMSSNPVSTRWIVALMALYLHLGPFSRDGDRTDREHHDGA